MASKKTIGKYEKDLQIVNSILNGKSENDLSFSEAVQLLNVYSVAYHESGKIEDLFSCDSSAHGCDFCNKMRKAAESDPTIICGYCYDWKQEEYRTNVLNRHSLNLRIMKSVLFTVEQLAFLPCGMYNRINSSGEIDNLTQARNMIRYAKAHPNSNVTMWSKNKPIVEEAFKLEGKPNNMKFGQSSIHIDKADKASEYADFVFTVYSTLEKVEEALQNEAIRCNGIKCKDCMACYNGSMKNGQAVAELLRK